MPGFEYSWHGIATAIDGLFDNCCNYVRMVLESRGELMVIINETWL